MVYRFSNKFIAALALVFAAAAANAQVSTYQEVIVGSSAVTVTNLGGGGSFDDVLGYVDPTSGDLIEVGTSHEDYGNTVTLTGLTPGSELVLYLQSPSDFGGLGAVSATSDGPVYDVYTGPGSRNPDGDVHAVVVSDGIGGYDVNFEDELATYYIGSFGPYSSDFNYGDGQLVVSGVSVVNVTPGPAGALAFAAGAIGVRRRRRRTTR